LFEESHENIYRPQALAFGKNHFDFCLDPLRAPRKLRIETDSTRTSAII
jgi:hypothetical protein